MNYFAEKTPTFVISCGLIKNVSHLLYTHLVDKPFYFRCPVQVLRQCTVNDL